MDYELTIVPNFAGPGELFVVVDGEADDPVAVEDGTAGVAVEVPGGVAVAAWGRPKGKAPGATLAFVAGPDLPHENPRAKRLGPPRVVKIEEVKVEDPKPEPKPEPEDHDPHHHHDVARAEGEGMPEGPDAFEGGKPA